MSNFKGTKGKWFIKSTSYNRSWINISSEKGIIARTFLGEEEPIVNEKEAESNAKLIECAPEMLEMLEHFVNNNMLPITGEEWARQLIKKATE